MNRFALVALGLTTLACTHPLSAQSASTRQMLDFALEPPEIITKPGPEYADHVRDMNMVIGMDRSPGGRLWAAWVSGGDSELSYFVATTSDDGGKTWSAPRLVIDPADHSSGIPRRTLVGNFWTDPNGKLWFFFDQAMGYFDGRAGIWTITCDNPDATEPVWSKPRRIWDGCVLNKPTVLASGEWLMPVSLWQRSSIKGSSEKHRPTIDKALIPADFNDHFHELDEFRMANVLVSTDQGATWTRRGGVRFPHFRFDEPMIVELKDGRLWMLARTSEDNWESYSSDQGRTWTEPQKRFPHTSARFFLRRLASGRLLLVRHGNLDERLPKRSHLRAFLSDDDGQTWQGGLLLDEREPISYPDGFEGPDGLIQIIYDRSRYGAAEILTASFREDDILKGELHTPGARSKVLVNKATGKVAAPAEK